MNITINFSLARQSNTVLLIFLFTCKHNKKCKLLSTVTALMHNDITNRVARRELWSQQSSYIHKEHNSFSAFRFLTSSCMKSITKGTFSINTNVQYKYNCFLHSVYLQIPYSILLIKVQVFIQMNQQTIKYRSNILQVQSAMFELRQ